MYKTGTVPSRLFLFLGAVMGWFALASQFYININSGIAQAQETIIRYFSYFTIDTNGLAALAMTVLLLAPASALGRFFSRPPVMTAIAVYIIVVGLVYNLVLRSLWDPQGIQWAVDEMLHSILPALFVVYWWLFVAVRRMQWKVIPGWMLYPLFYCIIIMMRGASSGFYPYPFLDPVAVGYREVLVTIAVMMVLFFGVAFALVWISKILRKRLLLKN